MLDEKSSFTLGSMERELLPTILVTELLITLHEFLALLTEFQYAQSTPTTPDYLSLIISILHILTDVETQLTLARTSLERDVVDPYPVSTL